MHEVSLEFLCKKHHPLDGVFFIGVQVGFPQVP